MHFYFFLRNRTRFLLDLHFHPLWSQTSCKWVKLTTKGDNKHTNHETFIVIRWENPCILQSYAVYTCVGKYAATAVALAEQSRAHCVGADTPRSGCSLWGMHMHTGTHAHTTALYKEQFTAHITAACVCVCLCVSVCVPVEAKTSDFAGSIPLSLPFCDYKTAASILLAGWNTTVWLVSFISSDLVKIQSQWLTAGSTLCDFWPTLIKDNYCESNVVISMVLALTPRSHSMNSGCF